MSRFAVQRYNYVLSSIGLDLCWRCYDVAVHPSGSLICDFESCIVGNDEVVLVFENVDQFQSGVFFGSRSCDSLFRDDPATDDEEWSAIGDAVLEIRAFDYDAFDLYLNDLEISSLISGYYGVAIGAPGDPVE